MGKKRQKKNADQQQQNQNDNINEATRIRISQILEDFLASKAQGEIVFRLFFLLLVLCDVCVLFFGRDFILQMLYFFSR